MGLLGDADPGPDLLSGGGDRPRHRRTWLIGAAGAVVAGAVALAVAAHDPAAGRDPAAAGAPTAPAGHRAAESLGAVFLQHLPRCTQTDHHHLLRVAFGVSNLGQGPLVLLGASPIVSDNGVLRLTRVRLGDAACADRGDRQPVRLGPSGAAVVAMTFHVTSRCPHDSLVAARVTFDAGAAGIVHSESSALTDLSRLAFAQC
jgi:hypothetical protein